MEFCVCVCATQNKLWKWSINNEAVSKQAVVTLFQGGGVDANFHMHLKEEYVFRAEQLCFSVFLIPLFCLVSPQ